MLCFGLLLLKKLRKFCGKKVAFKTRDYSKLILDNLQLENQQYLQEVSDFFFIPNVIQLSLVFLML